MNLLFVLGLVLAVTSAVRSTWSPCGVSMLSVITPLQEQGRGNRFRATAIWFLIGATIGGAMLGGLVSLGAMAWAQTEVHVETALLIVAVGALVGVISDGKLFGFQLPGHDRQVNERWLDRYRAWVYGAGFGWQIGVGLATYIMTSGLYLFMLVGALGGSPVEGLIFGIVFGLVRGMAVFASRHVLDLQSLGDFHRRFESLRQPVRKITIAVIATSGVVAGVANGSAGGLAVALLVTTAAVAALEGERETSYALAG